MARCIIICIFLAYLIHAPGIAFSESSGAVYQSSAVQTKEKTLPVQLDRKDHLARLYAMIGSNDSIALSDDNGNLLLSKNIENKLVPASTLKLLTSLASIHYLGEGYRFHTDFFLDRKNNLKIKGYGDPLFLSETINEIAGILKKSIHKINDIVLDDSYFKTPVIIPGKKSSLQPYDAPNNAICANFNTVNFKMVNGRYKSAEVQTPLIPYAMKKIIDSGLKKGRITLSDSSRQAGIYAGALLKHFLEDKGIACRGEIRMGRVDPARDRLILNFVSKYTLTDIIKGLMAFSNNFTANQILITSGTTIFGSPATIENGVDALRKYTVSILGNDDFEIVEGSGISRKNRLSTGQMITILGHFRPYIHLLNQDGSQFYKTGTLNGIRTKAGFILGNNDKMFRFAVFYNTPGRNHAPAMKLIMDLIR